jgi:hypothetical protein
MALSSGTNFGRGAVPLAITSSSSSSEPRRCGRSSEGGRLVLHQWAAQTDAAIVHWKVNPYTQLCSCLSYESVCFLPIFCAFFVLALLLNLLGLWMFVLLVISCSRLLLNAAHSHTERETH